MNQAAASAGLHPVEQLAEDFVTRYRRGERPSLTEFVKQYPEVSGELADIIQALLMLEDLGAANEAESALPIPEQLGEYRIVREIGRGGMGVVYEAEQSELGRHVALKVLPTASQLRPTHLERFRRETRAAARLHHTNIIPIYGVGAQDGIHYYAMQYIEGRGLDAFLTDSRQQRKSPSADTVKGEATLRSGTSSSGSIAHHRDMAQIALQIADALSHAHEHGVLHRDIKPANILLDQNGVAWLGDFGLAYLEGDESLTSTGGFVGTLRYLPPERFEGEGDSRSDVYSFGATLYELLTLRPMFNESDRTRLIRQITQEDPPEPRRLDRTIPKDLETVVLKSIAKNPNDRYATSAELAEDLRRFLADRPLAARRISSWERFRRWVRRNPVIAGLLTAVFLSLGVGLGATWWQWRRADENLVVAQRESDLAWRAVRATLSGLGGTFGQPMVELRRNIYEEMLRLHQELATDSQPARRLDRAVIARGLAKAQLELGNGKLGIDAYRESLSVLENLVEENPNDAQVKSEFGQTLVGMASALGTSRAKEAEPLARRGAAIFREMATASPTSQDAQLRLANALRTWAKRQRQLQLPDGDARRDAADILAKLHAQKPESLEFAVELADARLELAACFIQDSRMKDAEETALTAQKLTDQLLSQWPDRCDVIVSTARVCDTLGTIHYNNGADIPAALAHYRRGVDLYRALIRQDPNNMRYLDMTGVALHNLAKCVGQHDDPAEAHRLLDEGTTYVKQALAINPLRSEYLLHLYRMNEARGIIYLLQSDHAAAARVAAEVMKFRLSAGQEAVFAAKLLCNSAPIAIQDRKLEQSEGSRLADGYFKQAMANLELAVERGFTDTIVLQKSPLRGLSRRPGFKELVAKMEQNRKAAAKEPKDNSAEF